MSEATIYFLLAQLFTFTTASLRLAIGFLGVSFFAFLLSLWWRQEEFTFLCRYWAGWMLVGAVFGFFCTSVERVIIGLTLPYENPFILHGWYLSGIFTVGGVFFMLLSHFKDIFSRWDGKIAAIVIYCLLFVSALFIPSFSRSDKVIISTFLILPAGLAIGLFPMYFVNTRVKINNILSKFNIFFIISFVIALFFHVLWLNPISKEIPHDGQLYPFFPLNNWFLAIFMIIYLGNLYIQYWLKQSKGIVQAMWAYLLVATAMLLVWFNTNIFDTFAL